MIKFYGRNLPFLSEGGRLLALSISPLTFPSLYCTTRPTSPYSGVVWVVVVETTLARDVVSDLLVKYLAISSRVVDDLISNVSIRVI